MDAFHQAMGNRVEIVRFCYAAFSLLAELAMEEKPDATWVSIYPVRDERMRQPLMEWPANGDGQGRLRLTERKTRG